MMNNRSLSQDLLYNYYCVFLYFSCKNCLIQEFEGKSKRTFYFQLHFSESCAVFLDSVVQCGDGQATDGNMTRYMCFACCCITNAADKHS